MRIKFSLLLLILFLFFMVIGYIEKESKIKYDIESQIQQYGTFLYSTQKKYKSYSDLIFDTKIDVEQIVNIYKKFNLKIIDISQARNLTNKYLEKSMNHISKYNVQGIELFLPNSKSIGSMYYLSKIGKGQYIDKNDIDYVSKTHKKLSTFNIGVEFTGNSFLYPLFDKENYIGCVKISYDTYSLVSSLSEYFHQASNFLILKTQKTNKIAQIQNRYLVKSLLEDFYFEKDIVSKVFSNYQTTKLLSKRYSGYIKQQLLKKKPFFIYDNSAKKLVLFLPIEDPFTKDVLCVITVNGKIKYLEQTNRNFLFIVCLSIVFLIVIFYMIYRKYKLKDTLKYKNKLLTTVIQKANSPIAIINHDGTFMEVNQACCKLLGYTSKKLIGLNCIDLTEDTYKLESKKILDSALVQNEIIDFHKQCISSDGTIVELNLNLYSIEDTELFVMILS